jgi:ABC-type phosphate transport system permease subunit
MDDKQKNSPQNHLPDEATFQTRLKIRHLWGKVWRVFYSVSVIIAILALIVLFLNVVNSSIGSVSISYDIDPNNLSAEGRPIEALGAEELVAILIEYQGAKMPVLVRDLLSVVPNEAFTASTLRELYPAGQYPEGFADVTVNDIRGLARDEMVAVLGEFLLLNMSRSELETRVLEDIVKLQVVEAWPLFDAIFHYDEIVATHDAEFPEAELVRYQSWVDLKFLQTPMSSIPSQAGIRTALLGSLLMMLIVINVSLPLGVGAALYLEEYAKDNIFARLPQHVEAFLADVPLIPNFVKRAIVGLSNFNMIIELNVRNLAGVPSIIYGMLGLAIFVRVLAPVTSGVAFGFNVKVPSDERIAGLIREAAAIDFQLDETGQITGIAINDSMSYQQTEELIDIFRQYGTPSLTNTGGLALTEAEKEIAQVFGIKILSQIPPTALNYTQIEAGYVNFEAATLSAEQFSSLAQQLTRITGFTINGRTILSAALTLSLLILPIIIINAQEALRAVPYALREASYGLGATQWQTIWRTVLPASVPGIMTGTILAVSRAIGETAPLIVVGASTFLLTDPGGPFSKFTVLPIQIFTWTSRPQGEFQFIAAAAIIVLLSLVVGLNAIAIMVRNKFSVRY